MPNRLIKESICTSDTLDQLSWFEEVVFYRLIVNCDDYGRFDGRLSIVRNRLFPLKESVTVKAVEASINRLATVGLVCLYEVDGKPYLQLPTWENHQQIRAKKSKYPAPGLIGNHLISDDIKCPRNPIQSESNPNLESESEDSAEPASSSPPVILLPLNDGTDYSVSQEQCQEWAGLYPAVDVMQQLREMRGWLLSNSTKRKTRRGVQSFVTRWLGKEQDKGRSGAPRRQNGGNVFLDMLEEKT